MGKNKRKDHEVAEATETSGKMSRKEFEKELAKLQVELTRLQTWVRATGARVIVVFEGRDTAGKGGVISRITARTSPRVFRHVALPAPSDREKAQVYMQRYIAHFPAAGEIILFDRSWYNRAGVERVMGFCTEEQCERFLALVPQSSVRWSFRTASSCASTFSISAKVSSDVDSRRGLPTRSNTGS